MTNDCKEFVEFKSIIHNRELLKKELFLNGSYTHGAPSMTFCTSFFERYSNDPMYFSIIGQILELTYSTWHRYCIETNLMDKDRMEDAYCDIMSRVFADNGIK